MKNPIEKLEPAQAGEATLSLHRWAATKNAEKPQ